MPGYKTHLFGGIITFIPMYYAATKMGRQMPPLWALILLSATLLGSLVPDLDITSKIQRLFYICIAALFLIFLTTHQWIPLFITAGLALIVGILRHRTILHHPVFLALLPLPFIYHMSNNNIPVSSTLLPSLFFIAGSWSHILLDFSIKTRAKRP